MLNNIESFVTELKTAKHCIILTGAGISTLSGIPDFRGKNGLYTRTDVDYNKLFDLDYFYSNPEYYYTHAKNFIYDLDTKQSSIVHTTLAKLEKQGIVKTILTQNIDLLHQKAGSKHVLELHGSPAVHHCLSCKESYTFKEIQEMLEIMPVPLCKKCNQIIKPDIVFFGENLPFDVLTEAEEEAIKADLLIVLGSSLTVYPVAAIPRITLQNKGKLVIVNEDPTDLDNRAILTFTDLEEVFTALDKAFSK